MPRFGAPHPTNTTSACPALAAIVRIIAVVDDAGEDDLMAAAVRSNADDVERTDEGANIVNCNRRPERARWRKRM
jgi:hypothetical protein